MVVGILCEHSGVDCIVKLIVIIVIAITEGFIIATWESVVVIVSGRIGTCHSMVNGGDSDKSMVTTHRSIVNGGDSDKSMVTSHVSIVTGRLGG